MKYQSTFLLNLAFAMLISALFTSVAKANGAKNSLLELIYLQPTNKTEVVLKQLIESSEDIQDTIAFLRESFHYPKRLNLIFGGEDGPLYDPESNEILMPYFFMSKIEARFKANRYEETGVRPEQAAIDSFIHTIFHEFAHAAVIMYDLPIIGKEEDAADALAAVLLIEFFENGQEITISAADLFNLEDLDIEEFDESDYWAEHSLDAQRYYNALCFAYGSAPEQYKLYIEKEYFSEDRGETCINEYENTSRGWLKLLKPHMHI